jgi:spore coat polysaccharide biosynthesis predicted glycosyltransferase SpsG
VGDALSARIAVVADAGSSVGMGHIARCSGIAVALRCRGYETACRSYGAAATRALDGVEWEPVASVDELPTADAAALVVLDSYLLDADALRARPGAGAVAAIHDHGPMPRTADLVVDPASPDGGPRPGVLAGPAYAPLRPAYWGLPRRQAAGPVDRVLVTTGSGVSPGTGAELARAVAATLPGATVVLVVGPYERPDPIPGVQLAIAPPSLLPELMQADLAITAAGQTMLEAAAVGTPCVAVPLVDNQRRNAALLGSLGAVRVADPSGAAVAEALAELAPDVERRRQMARRSQDAVDGYGAHRIAFQIEQLVGSPRAPAS